MKQIVHCYFSTTGLLLFCVLAFVQAQQKNDLLAKIELAPAGDNVEIRANAFNLSEASWDLSYVMEVVRKDKSGNGSSNQQSGEFGLGPGESQVLSSIEINVSNDYYLEVSLRILNGEKEVASDKLVRDRRQGQEAQKNEGASGAIDLETEEIGFVIDETRTRFGREFYDMFYQKVHARSLPGVIRVVEFPGRGRATVIKLSYNDQLFFQQFLQTKYEQLEEQAELGFQVLMQRFFRERLIREALNPDSQ